MNEKEAKELLECRLTTCTKVVSPTCQCLEASGYLAALEGEEVSVLHSELKKLKDALQNVDSFWKGKYDVKKYILDQERAHSEELVKSLEGIISDEECCAVRMQDFAKVALEKYKRKENERNEPKV